MENIFLDIFMSFWQLVSIILRSFSPFLIGLTLAYLLNNPVEWVRCKIEKDSNSTIVDSKPPKRGLAILITYASTFILLSLIAYAFIILIIGSLPKGNILDTVEKVYNYFYEANILDQIEEKFTLQYVLNIIGNFAGSLVNIFIGIVSSIYLLNDKEFFLRIWQSFLSLILKQKHHGLINEILNEINLVLTTFLKGAFIDSLIVALLSSIVLSILEVKFAVIIGMLGGILNIIPYFGPFFGMIPAVLMALTSDGIIKALLTAGGLLLVQQLDSNYIYPKIVGSSIGLHPLFVLISLSVLGYFSGIIGMLLAVPIAGIIQVFIKKWAYR